MNYLLIGQNIKALRDNLNLKQEELAVFLNCERSTISKYENGTRKIPLGDLEKLCELLCIELEDILNENAILAQKKKVFAFRKENLSAEDLKTFAEFQKIVSNYIKIGKLEGLHE